MNFPAISILIPCLNEQDFIVDCITSLIKGNYPKDKIEILVIDGGSVDRTRGILKTLSMEHSLIKVLNNRKKIVPAALNLGIRECKYDIAVWVGAHATYDKDYLTSLITCHLNDNPASVGGSLVPVGSNFFSEAVALATSSKFGVGNAKYRTAEKKQKTDTVFGGVWKKQDIKKIGGFNEAWIRNQDYEINTRLRKHIGPLILEPRAKCYYYCRRSLSGLIKQYYQYGYWRMKTLIQHPSSLNLRILIPCALLIGLILSLLLSPFFPALSLVTPSLYVLVALAFTVYLCRGEKIRYMLALPVIFVSIHLSWATGFITSGFKSVLNRLNKKIKP